MLAGISHPHHCCSSTRLGRLSATLQVPVSSYSSATFRRFSSEFPEIAQARGIQWRRRSSQVTRRLRPISAAGASPQPLDLTEDNVKQVLVDAKVELAQLFDTSVGITGQVELAELDGPFVTISLRGKFWHERSMVLARLGNYLKQRIPEIMEVEIESEKMLDDSPENF